MTPQELKNSILQLAIQGKLVEQRPEEGTAEALYQEIVPFQHNITRNKNELDYSSMEYDLPDSWKWVEINHIFNFIDYRGKTPIKSSDGVFLITASNIRKGYMDYNRKEYISESEYLNRQSRGMTRKGDLLFTTEAPMGNAALCDLDKCSCGQRIITLQPFCDATMCPPLYMFFILSPSFQQQLLDNCTGTTAKGIKGDKFKHLLIPLPPLAEQRRIVEKIESLLPFIDRYAEAWERLEAFNKRFPLDMQKSLLQMAIQGKLVEQRPEEGTGAELYAQIQAEKKKLIAEGKIKKQKPLPEITVDEKPFDIPESWSVIRLGEAVSLLSGTDFKPEDYNDHHKGIPYITGASSLSDNGVIVNRWTETPKSIANLGDTLLVCKGSGYGKTVICDIEEAHIARQIMAIKRTQLLDMQYIKLFLNANIGLIKANGQGVIPGIDRGSVLKLVFPLPPLAEQHRIVARLNELLPLCERLK